MPRGRKPPAKRLQDNGFKLPQTGTIPTQYGDESTKPPQNVAEDPHAIEAWETVVRTLVSNGTWQVSDRLACQRYAIAHAACCHAENEVLAGKLTQQAQSGYTSISAALIAWGKASKICDGLEKAMGISVDSRRALSIEATAPVDEFDDFMSTHN